MADDRTLVAKALAGSAGAFEQLVANHQALVWHVVYRMVNHEEDARELCQEVFLRVYRKLGQFRFESSLATWIGHIAYSLAVRHVQRKRIPLVADDDAMIAVPDPDVSRDPFAQADATRVQARTQQAMAALAPLPRTIVSLYHLEELSVVEIGHIMGLPTGTVKSHLYRARKTLKATLTEEVNPDGF